MNAEERKSDTSRFCDGARGPIVGYRDPVTGELVIYDEYKPKPKKD